MRVVKAFTDFEGIQSGYFYAEIEGVQSLCEFPGFKFKKVSKNFYKHTILDFCEYYIEVVAEIP
jgi:hypothetical protein